ncbi:hypothetical protein ACFX12_023438 [Malus domestica]
MATIPDIQPPPKAPSFSAKLNRSNPLEFVEKALAFLARESDFFHRERVEREVASVVRTLREQERKKVERKKKADAEAAKLMEMEGSEKKADAEAAKLMEMESSEKKTTSETSSSSIPHYKVYAGKIDRRVFVHVYASILADQHDVRESERKWDRRMRAHRKICENHDESCFEYI